MNKEFDITLLMYKACEEANVWAEKEGEVYVGDTLAEIEFNVTHKNSAKRGKLIRIIEGTSYPFCIEMPDGISQYFALAYPIPPSPEEVIEVVKDETKEEVKFDTPRPVTYRPFKSKQEMLDFAYSRQRSKDCPPDARPLLWVKHVASGEEYLITGYCNNGVFVDNYVPFDNLLDEYITLDGDKFGVLQ